VSTQILIVDDDPGFRNALAFSFRRKGYQVLLAPSGKEAFELIQSNHVDLVISDIQMPGGDGIELLDRTREIDRAIPFVLLMTGYAELSTEDAYNKGADALFSKPFDRKLFEETIQRLLTPREERWSRSSEQASLALNIALRFQDLSVNANVVSLGDKGMFVTLPQRECPNVSDLLEFKISLDNKGALLDGSGVVRWVRISSKECTAPAGFGIEFTYLGNFERQRVVDYLETLRQAP
jgi:CheY-like chemotaxis protein